MCAAVLCWKRRAWALATSLGPPMHPTALPAASTSPQLHLVHPARCRSGQPHPAPPLPASCGPRGIQRDHQDVKCSPARCIHLHRPLTPGRRIGQIRVVTAAEAEICQIRPMCQPPPTTPNLNFQVPPPSPQTRQARAARPPAASHATEKSSSNIACKCKYCGVEFTSSITRLHAHVAGVAGQGINVCPSKGNTPFPKPLRLQLKLLCWDSWQLTAGRSRGQEEGEAGRGKKCRGAGD